MSEVKVEKKKRTANSALVGWREYLQSINFYAKGQGKGTKLVPKKGTEEHSKLREGYEKYKASKRPAQPLHVVAQQAANNETTGSYAVQVLGQNETPLQVLAETPAVALPANAVPVKRGRKKKIVV